MEFLITVFSRILLHIIIIIIIIGKQYLIFYKYIYLNFFFFLGWAIIWHLNLFFWWTILNAIWKI